MPGPGEPPEEPAALAVPEALAWLAARVAEAGGRAYLVGGGVRDHLLRRAVKDWDVEVFGLEVDTLRRLLERRGRVNAVGRAFGVLKWRTDGLSDEVDVSIPRRDSKVGPGHRGIAVVGDPRMSLEEATRRRDLTINALMWDLAAGVLVDPQGGARDLAAGVLRPVDPETFLEDPLRALRAVQFAARFGFAADPSLLDCCRRASLAELPAERILAEWEKLLCKGEAFRGAFALARAGDVLRRVFPDVADLDPGPTLEALLPLRDRTDGEGRRLALMLLGWLAPAPAAAVVATLDRLHLVTRGGYRVRERILAAHAAQHDPAATDRDLRWLATRAEPWLVLGVRHDPALARAEALGLAHEPPPPLLQGRHLRHLGVPPGPEMGRLLEEVRTAQLDGALATEADAVAWMRRRLSP